MKDYKELTALANLATPGPWQIANERDKDLIVCEATAGRPFVFCCVAGALDNTQKLSQEQADHNAAYIAAASPEVVKELITTVEVLELHAESLKRRLNKCRAIMEANDPVNARAIFGEVIQEETRS